MLRVTLDTNALDHRARLEAACTGLSVELDHTTVTDRETEGTSWATRGAKVHEVIVLDESHINGGGVLASEEDAGKLELILAIITSGSFPKRWDRASLTQGQRAQLRDAMVLEAHARNRRDVLVTEDATAFVNHGKRAKLEALCRTRIMTVDEFCSQVGALAEPLP